MYIYISIHIIRYLHIYNSKHLLVGGLNPLKNMKVSWDVIPFPIYGKS